MDNSKNYLNKVKELKKKLPDEIKLKTSLPWKRVLNIFVFAIIGLSLPISLILLNQRQDIRQRAQVVAIDHLAFQPSGIQTQLSPNQKIPLSVLAYGVKNEPIFDGVTYQWGISSTGSVGTLSEVSGSIASFIPQKNGRGDIFVTATLGSQTITGSVPVVVGNVAITSPTPISKCFAPGDPIDINRDGVISQSDLEILRDNFLKDANTPELAKMDIDHDGKISILDISLVSRRLGETACPLPTTTPTPIPVTSGFRGEYFSNKYLSGRPTLVRDDANINFDWKDGSPAPGIIPSDGFSVSWTKNQLFTSGNYRFRVRNNDGMRVIIDGRIYYNRWFDQDASTRYFIVNLSQGYHAVTVQYYENTGSAVAELSWTKL